MTAVICLCRMSSPFLSSVLKHPVRNSRYGCVRSCRGGGVLGEGARRERRPSLFSRLHKEYCILFAWHSTCFHPHVGLCLSLDFYVHPISPVQAEFLSETIGKWGPQIFRNKAWNWVSCSLNTEVNAASFLLQRSRYAFLL